MGSVGEILDSVVANLSDENYAQSLAHYRLWFEIGQTHRQITSDRTFDAIRNKITTKSSISPKGGKLIHSTAHTILRFANDVESDHILAPHNSGLQTRLCAKTLQEFISCNLTAAQQEERQRTPYEVTNIYDVDPDVIVCAEANFIAHWANLGYVEESTIRNQILQSLIDVPHSKLCNHQADALIILFKLAGATFEAYSGTSVVDRCFELLKNHYNRNSVKRRLVQEVVALRERGWEGLPPPPVFATEKPKLACAGQKDPAATPVSASLGLPNRDLELVIASVSDTTPVSPTTPVTQSPSTSIATLSDFTIADASDDELPIDPAVADVSDDEPPNDPTAAAPHETFYFEDGNAEVLCGNTLFRVHTAILFFHSPVLRQILSQNSLATAESPNGCPRILSSDTPRDFATLLKTIYLPGFPERNKVPDFTTFSSLLRITTKYEMPTVRSQLLEVVRDAYPETFEELAPPKPLGERVFSGPIPHPNAVLNLFVQQKLTSALPMAYYMAARRGLDSLMDRRLPASARLTPEILQVAIRGLMTLREVELNETHRLIFGPKGTQPCSTPNCPSRAPTGPAASEAYQKVFGHISGSSQLGTNLLRVPEFYEDRGSGVQCVGPGICSKCVEGWVSEHAELRKKAWAMLPGVFGLKG